MMSPKLPSLIVIAWDLGSSLRVKESKSKYWHTAHSPSLRSFEKKFSSGNQDVKDDIRQDHYRWKHSTLQQKDFGNRLWRKGT